MPECFFSNYQALYSFPKYCDTKRRLFKINGIHLPYKFFDTALCRHVIPYKKFPAEKNLSLEIILTKYLFFISENQSI